jgi:large subunit ribosomal protein L22
MSYSATLKYRRGSPRRLRLAADLVRGKNVLEALEILSSMPKGGAAVLVEVIRSARANAIEMDKQKNLRINPDRFVIADLQVDGGPIIRRFRPMSMGRSGRIRKRTSHVTVILDEQSAAPKRAGRRA